MKERTFVLPAPVTGDFVSRLSALEREVRHVLSGRDEERVTLVWCRAFLSDAANQLPLLRASVLYADVLSRGAFSWVEQPPLDCSKITLILTVTTDSVTVSGTPDRCAVACGGVKRLYHSVRFTADEVAGLSSKEQTEEAFGRHIDWLKAEGLSLADNCVRTWLYVRDIDHNYHGVVEGRNAVFAREGLTKDTHFIASTGIGGQTDVPGAAVAVDFWSVDAPALSQHYLQALEWLNPTHEYGVAFERGVRVSTGDGGASLYISGTASIDRHGRCIHQNDVPRQADRLFENISHLLADGGATLDDLVWMTVYLRDLSDCGVANEYLNGRFPNVPRIVVLAPVCRPQWLIEVETMASVPATDEK